MKSQYVSILKHNFKVDHYVFVDWPTIKPTGYNILISEDVRLEKALETLESRNGTSPSKSAAESSNRVTLAV